MTLASRLKMIIPGAALTNLLCILLTSGWPLFIIGAILIYQLVTDRRGRVLRWLRPGRDLQRR